MIRLTIFDLIRRNCGFSLIRLKNNSIQSDSCLTYLFLTRLKKFDSHFNQASGSPTLARVSSKYFSTEIVEYSTILKIEIGFDKNILTKKNRYMKIYPHPSLFSGNPIHLIKAKKERARWGNPLENSGCSLQLVELTSLWSKKPKRGKKELSGGTTCKIIIELIFWKN